MRILIFLFSTFALTFACRPSSPPVCPPGQTFNHLLCRCVCAFSQVCRYPSEWNYETCSCTCPWWSGWLCPKNKYWDPRSCTCRCKEPCKDCTRPQIWYETTCSCGCPYIKKCPKNQYWSNWDCDCNCKQKPRVCCDKKIWSKKSCDCVCQYPMSCIPGYEWDPFRCRCVKKSSWWNPKEVDELSSNADVGYISFAVDGQPRTCTAILTDETTAVVSAKCGTDAKNSNSPITANFPQKSGEGSTVRVDNVQINGTVAYLRLSAPFTLENGAQKSNITATPIEDTSAYLREHSDEIEFRAVDSRGQEFKVDPVDAASGSCKNSEGFCFATEDGRIINQGDPDGPVVYGIDVYVFAGCITVITISPESITYERMCWVYVYVFHNFSPASL